MLDTNYLIIDRVPREFDRIIFARKTMIFIGRDGKPVDNGTGSFEFEIYTILNCDETRNVTMVTDLNGVHKVVTVLWCDEEQYRQDLDKIKSASGMPVYAQNKKINRYADAIKEKLDGGIYITATDTVAGDDMVPCPECGTLNSKGAPYCMECGAPMSDR